MYKKGNKIKLTEQKGITAADAVLAMLIILTALGVITMVYTNLVIGSRGVDRKAGATRIATNVLENMSQHYYDDIQLEAKSLDPESTTNEYTIIGGKKIYGTTIPEGYILKIKFTNSSGFDKLASKAIVSVEYKVANKVEKVELSKSFSRELSRECNSPNFDDEYLNAAEISGRLYSTQDTAESDKYICPVQYDGNNYKILSKEELYEGNLQKIWYSYSNRQWARILYLTRGEITICTGSDGAQYISQYLRDSSKSYVWVPRYGISNNTVYFKYQDTDNAILFTDENEFFYYMDTKNSVVFSANYSGIDFESKKGKWMSYDKLTKSIADGKDNEAFWLNNSQKCGPIIEY